MFVIGLTLLLPHRYAMIRRLLKATSGRDPPAVRMVAEVGFVYLLHRTRIGHRCGLGVASRRTIQSVLP